jgi:hypothetical protein
MGQEVISGQAARPGDDRGGKGGRRQEAQDPVDAGNLAIIGRSKARIARPFQFSDCGQGRLGGRPQPRSFERGNQLNYCIAGRGAHGRGGAAAKLAAGPVTSRKGPGAHVLVSLQHLP